MTFSFLGSRIVLHTAHVLTILMQNKMRAKMLTGTCQPAGTGTTLAGRAAAGCVASAGLLLPWPAATLGACAELMAATTPSPLSAGWSSRTTAAGNVSSSAVGVMDGSFTWIVSPVGVISCSGQDR